MYSIFKRKTPCYGRYLVSNKSNLDSSDYFYNTFIGLGGTAIVFMIGMLKVQIQGKTLDIPFEPTFQNMVFVFFLSLLSGFYSKTFLHILEKFFKNYGKIAEEAKKEAEEATA